MAFSDNLNLAGNVPVRIKEIEEGKTYLLAKKPSLSNINDIDYIPGSELLELAKSNIRVLDRIIPAEDFNELAEIFEKGLSEEEKEQKAKDAICNSFETSRASGITEELEAGINSESTKFPQRNER